MEVFNDLVNPRLDRLAESVGAVKTTLRSFYSNGSGGPPGALEIWRAEDEKLYKERRAEEDKRYDGLKAMAEVAKENGETFKDFIHTYMTEREIRKRRISRYFSASKVVVPVIGTIVLGILTLIWKSAAPIIQDVWTTYHQTHQGK